MIDDTSELELQGYSLIRNCFAREDDCCLFITIHQRMFKACKTILIPIIVNPFIIFN